MSTERMTGVQTMTVADADGESRVDRWFKRHFPLIGHGRLEKLLRTGQVRIDGKRAKASDRIAPGQLVRIPPLDLHEAPDDPGERARPAQVQPRQRDIEALQRTVIYQDDDVIAIDKPAGLAVQGGTNTDRHVDMMLDGLRFGAGDRPRLVHRLDKDTSGVLLLARTAAAAARLAEAFRDKTTRKTYWAVLIGQPKPRQGRIDLALGKQGGRGGERVSVDDDDGKRAVTYYSVLESAAGKASFVALLPVTGRTHQLRVHCAELGTPILGDGKYGGAIAQPGSIPGSRNLHLHAQSIEIPHPAGGMLRVEAPLPDHMRKTFDFFGFDQKVKGDPFEALEI